jgi:hypothetical protein
MELSWKDLSVKIFWEKASPLSDSERRYCGNCILLRVGPCRPADTRWRVPEGTTILSAFRVNKSYESEKEP